MFVFMRNGIKWPSIESKQKTISGCNFVCLLWIFPFFAESSKEQFASTNIAEELVKLFKKQIEHDKREMIFEVLAPLAENGEKINVPLDFWSCRLFLILFNCQLFNSKRFSVLLMMWWILFLVSLTSATLSTP